MTAPRPANRPTPLVLALAALLGSCAVVNGGREFDVELSARGLPGVGAGVGVAQRLLDRGSKRIDLELGLERQELSDEGPDGEDDWTRLAFGLRCAAAAPEDHFLWRAGATWLRSDGDAPGLEPGDFGGVYLGTGYVWELAPALATGPELTTLFVDSEGSRDGSGAVLELAWRWVWHL